MHYKVWHAFGHTIIIVFETLNFTAMKTKIIFSVLIIITTVGSSIAGSNERKDAAEEQNISMAEMEFISQCHDLHQICKKNLNDLESCLPEVVIIDKDCNILATGKKANLIVDQLMKESSFLTSVLGIAYYSLNYEIPWSTEKMVSVR